MHVEESGALFDDVPETLLAFPERLLRSLAIADVDEDSPGADDSSVPHHGNGIDQDREGAPILAEGHVFVARGPAADDGVLKRLHGARQIRGGYHIG